MNTLPHLLVLFKLYSNEKQSFRKVHRMIDLFESIIKTHTVVILSEYVRHNKLSDSAKGLLAQGLRTPSLGTWQLFSRVLFEELQREDHSWSFVDFPSEFRALDKALNAEKTNVIAMRNGYAHGATPTDEQCEADVRKFEPFLLKLMGLNWLMNTSFQVKEGLVFFTNDDGGSLCLHPLLLYRDEACDASFAFFNDLKNDKVGLLNYPLGKHYREREFYSEFLEILPLNEWKSSGNNEFQQRIDELTETFKGRTLERDKLIRFVVGKNKGYLSIQGNPGIGKSALIAQFFKDLKHQEICKSLRTVEYFIRRGTQQAQVDFMLAYLIRRTDEFFPAGKEIRAEGKTTFDVQSQLFAKWRLWSEQSKGQKLLFLIDGLDEGTENNVLAYLPRENFENILFVYGSRPGGHKSIDDLWATLPAEHHTKVELQGLGKEDIRALIYEVANKYEIERESPWIDAVLFKSQGNPLYLKLLCDSIEQGGVAVNDVPGLPEKIEDYYKAILNRYAQDAIDGDALLFSLFTFAAAHDFLTISHIGHINNLGPAATQRICTTLKEVLYENPLTEEVLDYQLFHESFREYLIREFAKEILDANHRIIEFCSRWTEFEGSWEQRYALEHYALHLSSSGKAQQHETLLNLIEDQSFAATQKKVLKNFEASKRLLQLALLKSIELQKEDHALEAALQLVDLKYEESNDAPQVVALASSGNPGDIELALKRIESFGGVDQNGVQRKFTLYMLCLMELTLLNGSGNPNRKSLIAKLLNHFDEHLPTDYSLLDWSNHFSSYLMFLMACVWTELGLDVKCVYKRTSTFSIERGPHTEIGIFVLLETALGISDDRERSAALKTISGELAKQGQIELALETARGICDNYLKSEALLTISVEFAKQGQLDSAVSVMQVAFETARGSSDDRERSYALAKISGELAKQGQLDSAELVLQDALETARGISDDYLKSEALRTISGELAKQGQIELALETALGISHHLGKDMALGRISYELAKKGQMEAALDTVRGISGDYVKSETLANISSELANQGQQEAAESVMQDALETARGISDYYWKSLALKTISEELAKQGQMEAAIETVCDISDEHARNLARETLSDELAKQGRKELALETARGISDYHGKSMALKTISEELAKQGKLDSAASVMRDTLETARGISGYNWKSIALKKISEELAKQGQMEAASETARGISHDALRIEALTAISDELAKHGQLDSAELVLQDALETTIGISDDYLKSEALRTISEELAKQGQIELALDTVRGFSNYQWKDESLETISYLLAKQGQMEAALETVRGISGDKQKSQTLANISSELANQGQLEAAASVMQDALETAHGIRYWKSEALQTISRELARQGQTEAALETVRGISADYDKSQTLANISSELANQGQLEAAASVMQDALETARGISNYHRKSMALETISGELAKQGQIELALETAHDISSDDWKSEALLTISRELAKQGLFEDAESVGFTIHLSKFRFDLFKEIAVQSCEKHEMLDALRAVHVLQRDESKLFYLKGWTDNINFIDVKSDTLFQSLHLLIDDIDSIEQFLQKYAQHQVFFGTPTPGFLSRLNKSLNIQWLLDVHQKLPKDEVLEKSWNNVDAWIKEISDPDDRDDIRAWAEKVASGSMTEEKFKAKVQALM